MAAFGDRYGYLVEDIQTIVEAANVYNYDLDAIDDKIFEVTQDLGYVLD